jgi:hypothetical protein
MSSNLLTKRYRTGFVMSIITLFAGVSGFVYQFIPDGTFLTLFVCIEAILGLINISSGLDERDNQLLLQSYGTAFKFLFALILIIYFLIYISSWLNIAGPIIGLINSHWIGIMISTMCIFLGVVGIRNFREIK